MMGFTQCPVTTMANHNFVTWHRELLLIYCFHWFTCRCILVNQRLKHHIYFGIDVSLLVFPCSFVFSVLSFPYMLQLQTYCGESKVVMEITFVHIFCSVMKCSSVFSFECLWVSMFVHTLQLQELPTPLQHWGIWLKKIKVEMNPINAHIFVNCFSFWGERRK